MRSVTPTNPDSVAIRARRVSKRYGNLVALKGFDLVVPSDRTLGIVGESGAGKSTALAIFAGLVVPSEGEVTVLGRPPGSMPGEVGALVGRPSFPQNARVGAFLEYLAKLQLLPCPKEEVRIALERIGASAWTRLRFLDLTREKQRLVAVAQAWMGSPRVVLLDGALDGLDGRGRELARRVLADQRGKATILVSSDHPDELADVCDERAVMAQGSIVSRAGKDEAGVSNEGAWEGSLGPALSTLA